MFSFRALDNEWCKITKSCVLWDGAGPAHTKRGKRKEKQNNRKAHTLMPSLPPIRDQAWSRSHWLALTLGVQPVRLRGRKACWPVPGLRTLPNRIFVSSCVGREQRMSENTHSPLSFSKQHWAQIVFSALTTLPKLLERVVLPVGMLGALAVPSAGSRAPLIWEGRDTFSWESWRMSGCSAERLGEGLALICLPGTGEEELQQKVWKANWLSPLGAITS